LEIWFGGFGFWECFVHVFILALVLGFLLCIGFSRIYALLVRICFLSPSFYGTQSNENPYYGVVGFHYNGLNLMALLFPSLVGLLALENCGSHEVLMVLLSL